MSYHKMKWSLSSISLPGTLNITTLVFPELGSHKKKWNFIVVPTDFLPLLLKIIFMRIMVFFPT